MCNSNNEIYWQKEIETAPREQIRAWQDERLVNTVKHVYDNVELYRNRMKEAGVSPDDIRSRDDLYKLPFTYKQDLRDTYPYGLFAVPLKDVVRIHASSGTTGKQIVAGYTKRDLEIWDEICARQLCAAGADKDSRVHVSYGYGLFTGGLGFHGAAHMMGAMTIPASSGNTQRQMTLMEDLGSTHLCCTPSYAMFLGESLEAKGVDTSKLPLRAGIFGAEPWTEEMRKQIEEKLHIKAFDVYGLTEIMGPGVSYECSDQHGMHVNEDHFIIEVINPETGEPLPNGEQGEIVFPSQIDTVLLQQGYSPNYQIIVDREGTRDIFTVKVEMNENMFSDSMSKITKEEENLEAALRSLLGITADVSLVAPKSITRSEGKAVRVIDKRKLV